MMMVMTMMMTIGRRHAINCSSFNTKTELKPIANPHRNVTPSVTHAHPHRKLIPCVNICTVYKATACPCPNRKGQTMMNKASANGKRATDVITPSLVVAPLGEPSLRLPICPPLTGKVDILRSIIPWSVSNTPIKTQHRKMNNES